MSTESGHRQSLDAEMWHLTAEREARLRLNIAVEPLDGVVTPKLVGLSAQDAWTTVQNGLGGPFERCRARIEQLELDRLLDAARCLRMRPIFPGDDEWPTGLDDLAVPPWCLWARGHGRLDQLVARSVAIVGSRAATPYGSTLARTLAAELSSYGVTVVSGAAFGIDAAAHEGALGSGSATVAALACGLDRAYPAAHRDLLDRIRDDGVLVSEYPPGQTPMKYRFLARNRLIAALTGGTVVVEAGLRSGSLNTASYANDLGRPVGAMPGPVTSATSAGSHELIRQGAHLVCDASEVIELLGPFEACAAPDRREPDTLLDLVSEVAARTRDAFPATRTVNVDQLVARAGLAVAEVLAGLGELNALGLAEQRNGGWRLVRGEPGG